MTITGDLFLKTWENLDSNELRLLFNEKIGGTGQVNGGINENAPFYLPMADDTCQIILKFKKKKINSISPGKSFNEKSWVEISQLIDGLVNGGQSKVGRQISFSTKRVDGYWRGRIRKFKFALHLRTLRCRMSCTQKIHLYLNFHSCNAALTELIIID